MGVARTGLSFALLVAFTLAVAFPARADDVIQVYPDTPQPTAENGLEMDETPSSWFVELTEPSTSDGGSAATVAASHDRFKVKHDLSVALAADPDRNAIEAYGVWAEKSMYGRKYMGVERSTFLIGRDGRIARQWRKVKVKGHVEEVLEAARAL